LVSPIETDGHPYNCSCAAYDHDNDGDDVVHRIPSLILRLTCKIHDLNVRLLTQCGSELNIPFSCSAIYDVESDSGYNHIVLNVFNYTMLMVAQNNTFTHAIVREKKAIALKCIECFRQTFMYW